MAKTTNILDLNNRLEKVEKENVAQNSYTALKNKPKINGVTLTGNKSLVDLGAAAASDLTTLAGDVGDKAQLTTTDKSSMVAAINEVVSAALTYGIYVVNDATDIKDFIKKLITQAHSDLATKNAHTLYNIFALYTGINKFYGTVERQDTSGYSFSLSSAGGDNIYQGYCDLATDSLTLYEFTGTLMS